MHEFLGPRLKLWSVVLMALGGAACATVGKAPADSQRVEAQKAFDEGQRLAAAGHYGEAAQLLQRALAIEEAALEEKRSFAASLENLAEREHRFQGQHARAMSLRKRVREIREELLLRNHPRVIEVLHSLANLYERQGHYAHAGMLLRRALAMEEGAFGKEHPRVANSLHGLANLYSSQGFYARAEPFLRRALVIQEAAPGENHQNVATTLARLADLYRDQGRYARAEPLLLRALMIREATLGRNHPDVASALASLADLYRDQGRYTQAEQLLQRALVIREEVPGKNHPDSASSLHSLGSLYSSQGDYAQAEPLLERALSIWEETLGGNHPRGADSLHSLGSLYSSQGLYARAEPLLQRALAIRETVLGKSHPDIARSLHTLASLSSSQGDYSRAESFLERALTIREAALGPNHLDVALSLNQLARLRLAQQRLDEALQLFERAFAVSEEHLRQEALSFSEAHLAGVLQLLRADEERLYALARVYPGNARVRHLALTAALLRKGRSAEEIAGTSRLIYRVLGQFDREAFERLRAVRAQFSKLSLAGPTPRSPADYQQRLKDLASQGDALELDLSQRIAPMRTLYALPPPAEVIARVAGVLPKDGALVEFVAYRDSSIARYLALLLFADGRTSTVDLGSAEPIDRAALRLHHALADRVVSFQPAAQEFYKLAFHPLVPALGKVRRLFLAPDGQFALIPFAALHDGTRFLVDTIDITYLTSGKDLLRHPKGSVPVARSVVVLGDPDFGAPLTEPSPAAETAPVLAERAASLEHVFTSLRAELADQPWLPLPGTRQEAEAIQRLFPQARTLLGSGATKDALLRLEAPGILHIATHGFFLEDASTPLGARAVGYFGAVGESGPLQSRADPLLRSGLVLAGAQAQKDQDRASHRGDSLVTALELSGLDLWGTQLVVLSACDTGRGDVKLGQGVYGLRRALVVAGAETLVTSLWKVNDETTRDLMEAYYRNLLAGQGRTAALREAMRSLRQKQPHPHFWAPFIAIGQDSPLQGLVPYTPARTEP